MHEINFQEKIQRGLQGIDHAAGRWSSTWEDFFEHEYLPVGIYRFQKQRRNITFTLLCYDTFEAHPIFVTAWYFVWGHK